MGTLYSSQAAAGYNSSPPPDDGSQGANNQITWNTTIKAKLADPIKALADAINSQLTTVLDLSPRAISTNDSAIASDHWRTLQVTGTTTITLSDAATMTNKYVVGVANLGVGTVTITRATAGNTVNGTAADFTLAPKQAVMLGVNQAANGYNILAHSLASGASINAIQATTSVTTPLVAPSSGALTLGLTGQSVLPAADNTSPLGGASFRWSSLFTPIIDSGTTGTLLLRTNNGTTQLGVAHVSGVDFFQVQSNTGAAQFYTTGASANVNAAFATKGSGGFNFATDIFGQNVVQFSVLHTASATRAVTVTGSNGGNPTIGTTAGSLNVSAPLALSGGAAFESAEQTASVSTTTSVAHGLGRLPHLFFAVLRNKTAELNYSIGDEIALLGGGESTSPEVCADATNITIVTPSTFNILNKTTQALTGITTANWKIVVRAF